MNLTQIEKTKFHMYELGLQLNEMKSKGVKKVSIADYESLLDSYIDLLNYTEKLHSKLSQ